ncbi:PIN domain-containing protein [Chelatococcus sambhunathii]|uniref:Ribonuclease VapC n=1 Tax=Chelatococcus sambhunathii TaxID=363953 RepID=A0ABU1DKP9_9HYPH|nr:PIN domain-containing protein [Chelatococcus sambhunathii]MDR4308685.1 PIN domain-containing protein [Chelatococcus sambhunathii]
MANAKPTCFVDTNILIYAVDPTETEKRPIAADLLRTEAQAGTLVLSPQSLNECYRVLTDRRRLVERAEARRYIQTFARFCTAPLDFGATVEAWRVQDEFGFAWWDSLLLASASLAGCAVFASEDLQTGRRIGGLEIKNPFAAL